MLGRRAGPARPLGLGRAHHGGAHAFHDGLHIGEVQIDQARIHHQVGDRAHARFQHAIGQPEGVGHLDAGRDHLEQVLVGHDDQRVGHLAQGVDAVIGIGAPPVALEIERLGDDRDGQDAALARQPADHRRRTRSGPAPHAGGDEHHVRVVQHAQQVVTALFGGGGTDVGLAPRAQPLGQGRAQLQAVGGQRTRQRLGVGVGRDELDPLQAGFDHVVQRVAATAADPQHHDAGALLDQSGVVGGVHRMRRSQGSSDTQTHGTANGSTWTAQRTDSGFMLPHVRLRKG